MASSALRISGKVGRSAGSLARQADPSAASCGGTLSMKSSFLFWMVTQKMICRTQANGQSRAPVHFTAPCLLHMRNDTSKDTCCLRRTLPGSVLVASKHAAAASGPKQPPLIMCQPP